MSLLTILDLLGTMAFAASGALAAIRRDMDLFGVLVLGVCCYCDRRWDSQRHHSWCPPTFLHSESNVSLSVDFCFASDFLFQQKTRFFKKSFTLFRRCRSGDFRCHWYQQGAEFQHWFSGSGLDGGHDGHCRRIDKGHAIQPSPVNPLQRGLCFSVSGWWSSVGDTELDKRPFWNFGIAFSHSYNRAEAFGNSL